MEQAIPRDQLPTFKLIINPFVEMRAALAQGTVNSLNGLQNSVVSLLNLGLKFAPITHPGPFGNIIGSLGIQIPEFDWSKGMFYPETESGHWWSSMIGGESLLMLGTAGIGEVANIARLGWCFPAGTLISTADGLVPIEAIKPGHRVWAYDVVRSEWRLCAVLQTFRRRYEGHSTFVTVDGETIESTLFHPYGVVSGNELEDRRRRDHLPQIPDGATTPGRWVDAGDLQEGDLLLRDGRMTLVRRVCSAPYDGLVFNFAVDELEC